MVDLVGRQIEQYQILSLVGRGGMGAVYKAHDQHLARHVALKVMHPHLADRSQFKQRFMQEARAAAGLDHPSIVKIYDFGYQQEALFTVMPFIGGGSLADHNRKLAQSKKAARLDEALYLLAQVATALAYAHRQGIVHRDVKPDNVLLKRLVSPDREDEPPLRAVVTDFGLAKLVEGGVKTETGMFMGTLPYMSPEQALGKDLDGRSDIYSLGVILYQLATGQLPLQINSPTEAVRKHMHETPPPPRTVEPGLPAELEAIIERAIAKEPDKRFQSGTDMS
jgi:serine/threonine protein kinase